MNTIFACNAVLYLAFRASHEIFFLTLSKEEGGATWRWTLDQVRILFDNFTPFVLLMLIAGVALLLR